MSKVLLLNGSPRANGCTATALDEMISVFNEEGVDTELIQVGNKDIRGCIACGRCGEIGKCVFDDLVNEVAEKLDKADGLVVGCPVYYGSPNGTMLSFLDRLFYSSGKVNKHMKERPAHTGIRCTVSALMMSGRILRVFRQCGTSQGTCHFLSGRSLTRKRNTEFPRWNPVTSQASLTGNNLRITYQKSSRLGSFFICPVQTIILF